MDSLRAPLELKKSLKEIQSLVKDKLITKKQGRQMAAQAQAACAKLLAGGVAPAAVAEGVPGGEDVEEKSTQPHFNLPSKQNKNSWPCSDVDLCDEAEHYSTYAAGFIAVAKAWGEDTLLPGLGNTKAQVAPGRKHGPAGAGDRGRGYVDYEFLDGNGMRYHIITCHITSYHIISRMYHIVSRMYHIVSRTYHIVSCHVHITSYHGRIT